MIRPGHVLDRLKEIPDGSVHCVITSPPYWSQRWYGTEPQIWGGLPDCQHEWGDEIIRQQQGNVGQNSTLEGGSQRPESNDRAQNVNQGSFCCLCSAWRGEHGLEPTPELYIAHEVEIFREIRRVLRPDGTCWLNLGDSYTSGGRNDYHSDKLQFGSETHTPLNHRPMTPAGLKPKDLCGIPWRVALALQADGWWLRSDIIWAKPNPMPESVTDRPTRSHEYIFLLTKSARYFYDQEAVREPINPNNKGTIRAHSRPHPGPIENDIRQYSERNYDIIKGRNLRSVWEMATQPLKMQHFASFPEELVKRCILAGTSHKTCEICGAPWARVVQKTRTFESGSGKAGHIPSGKSPEGMQGGGETLDIRRGPVVHSNTLGFRPSCACQQEGTGRAIVLDPFGGAATTAVVAEQLGRDWILIELKPAYIEMSNKRLRGITRGLQV